ncbi:sigma 54-interacting transcriptional regulator [Kyrpidia spormannii]|uniref:sigma 54-interacting transcriptional regulator n=1 Tax=Kyrpidia spormannii TaxID=2055160 RepID=UPI0014731D7E|nr:sigma 54-interacting transcriptional regulator [Kyrpidia spormannii]
MSTVEFAQCLREVRWVRGDENVRQIEREAGSQGDRYVFFKDGSLYKALEIRIGAEAGADEPDGALRTCSRSFPVLCVPEPEVPYRTLDLLSEQVTLIDTDQGLQYVERQDYLVYLLTCRDWNVDWIRLLLHSIPMGLIVCDRSRRVVNYNAKALRMLKKSEADSLNMASIFGEQVLSQVVDRGEFVFNQVYMREGLLADFAPLQDHDGSISGLVVVLQDLPHIEEMAMELDKVKNLNRDLHAVLASLCDELFVIDPDGVVIRASQSKIITANHAAGSDPVGRNFFSDEAFSDLPTDVVRLVIGQKRRISMEWESGHGVHILFEANPVLDESGRLVRVVVTLRDITETSKLKKELKEVQSQSVRYKRELEALRSRLAPERDPLVWASTAMDQVMRQVERVSQYPSTILLLGESGVGKEVIARAIHERSPRRERPFVKINCAAIPESLLESELFGYTRGAFTGANAQGKMGLFEQGDGGIVFLDEISEIPLSLQAKLLRVIQEKEVYPVGGVHPRQLDVQIIAATNRNLREMVESGQFREDLYYRLNVIPIEIPPLRHRPEDISLLALHFLQELTRKYERELRWGKGALESLRRYNWPGNVRELRNVVERLVVTCDSDVIEAVHVESMLPARRGPVKVSAIDDIMPLREATEMVEDQLILLAMRRYHSTTKAARVLGVSQSTVSRKFQKAIQRFPDLW